ncbi:DUF3577 domain-containing protein [Corticibacter populi]|uniref:DUF3577 domain-containing protein n=1 Tax=Corticibacter populi TaxID=1550736 RepID=A0A3M6R0U0_9BURK|nr:DUF3577 domain-containing protein [Corticibacter populi]RMX08867.1 DUF3577 domain-containing protein [Corticibacter populi]RZS35493.1 uncharacterized protein DUF3577 [Corticibacter populi]
MQTQAREYFNLHTNGIGYLNSVRWVEVKGRGRKAESFLACRIAALRGSADEVDYTYFDVRVSGDATISIIDSLKTAVENHSKVLVNFRIGDIFPHLYERDVRDVNRRPTGQKEWATLIKGRLILVNSVKVNGEVVYRRPATETEEGEAAQHDDEGQAPASEVPQAAEPAPQLEVAPQRRPQRVSQPAQRPERQAPSGYRQQRSAPAHA